MIYLMHGFIASGKTTQAREIERLCQAVRITPDEWMSQLFGPNPPAATFGSRLATLFALLRPLWTALAEQGAEVVLDYGFWTRADRAEIEAYCQSRGLAFQWIDLSTPLPECRRRNTLRDATHQPLEITDATFDLLAQQFESRQTDIEPPSRVRAPQGH